MLVSSPGACTNPKVKSSTYSTENPLFSSEIVFIAQVEVDCGGEVCTHIVCMYLHAHLFLYMHYLYVIYTDLILFYIAIIHLALYPCYTHTHTLTHTHTHKHTLQSLSLHALVGDQLLPVSKGLSSTTSEFFQVHTCVVNNTACGVSSDKCRVEPL